MSRAAPRSCALVVCVNVYMRGMYVCEEESAITLSARPPRSDLRAARRRLPCRLRAGHETSREHTALLACAGPDTTRTSLRSIKIHTTLLQVLLNIEFFKFYSQLITKKINKKTILIYSNVARYIFILHTCAK